MTSEIRIVLKNFNRDLLIEELSASALPFILANLYGFERINRFVGAPRTEARAIVTDHGVVTDQAEPGEIRFEFATDLTTAEDAALDALLASHNSTQRTAEQNRETKDESDVDFAITQWQPLKDTRSGITSMTGAQLRDHILLLTEHQLRLERIVLREKRTPAI